MPTALDTPAGYVPLLVARRFAADPAPPPAPFAEPLPCAVLLARAVELFDGCSAVFDRELAQRALVRGAGRGGA